jgi:hypothetical protein
MFRDQPLVGIGQGKYGDVFSQYRDKTQVVHNVNVMTDSAHNTFVQFAASGGLILLLAYTGVVAIISKKVFRLYFSSYKQNVDVPIVALSAVWMGFLMQTLISPETTTLMYWGFFVGGLICAVHRKEFESEKKQKETNKIWKIIISFFSMAILTTSLYNSIIKSEAETQLQKALSLNIQNDSDQQAQYKARELLKVIDIAKNEMQYKYIVSEELLKLKYPQAAKLVVSSINSYSSDARALKLLARINLVENKTQEYIETLEKLKNIDPYNYKVKELMIQYYCKTGNNSKAQETVASINSQGLTKYISPKIKECLVQNDL